MMSVRGLMSARFVNVARGSLTRPPTRLSVRFLGPRASSRQSGVLGVASPLVEFGRPRLRCDHLSPFHATQLIGG